MKILRSLLSGALLLLFSCQEKGLHTDSSGFSLTGKTTALPDGTVLYLIDILSNQMFDSVSVRKNAFRIERRLTVSPTQIFIHTKDYAASKSIWIENQPMYLDASESDLGSATVTGSTTQLEFELLLQQIDTVESDSGQEEIATAFIKKYPRSRVSVSVLAGYAPNWGTAKVKELYGALSPENQESVYGLQVLKYIQSNRVHEVGSKFTDFEMISNTGTVLKFSEHLGRATLLEFWASWCGPCRAQNPDLVKTYQKYHEAGFEIFSVSLDFSKKDWEKAIEKDHLIWNHVSDLKGRNSTAGIIYGVNTIPDNLLIDKNGNILEKGIWGAELNAALEKVLHDK